MRYCKNERKKRQLSVVQKVAGNDWLIDIIRS